MQRSVQYGEQTFTGDLVLQSPKLSVSELSEPHGLLWGAGLCCHQHSLYCKEFMKKVDTLDYMLRNCEKVEDWGLGGGGGRHMIV